MGEKVGVIGIGVWGTSLGEALVRSGNEVLAWSPEGDVVSSVNKTHSNPRYLPGMKLSDNFKATKKIADLVKHCKTLFITVPANAHTEITSLISHLITSEHTIVVASKGFRESDGALLTDVWQELTPSLKNLAAISGPCLAIELAQEKSTCLVISSTKGKVMKQVGGLFNLPYLRIYYNDDIIGAQIGAAMKGVVAIAVGIADQLELGANARAAIVSRSLAEVMRYAIALGAKPDTIAGLSGLGDIFLLSTSPLSRNYRLGKKLAHGIPLQQALNDENHKAEGVQTARIVTAQATSRGVDLAIITVIDAILSGDIKADKAFKFLFNQPPKWEFEPSKKYTV